MVNKVGNCLVTIYRCITVRLTVSSYGQMAIRKMRQNKNIHITLCPEYHIMSRVRNGKTAGKNIECYYIIAGNLGCSLSYFIGIGHHPLVSTHLSVG